MDEDLLATIKELLARSEALRKAGDRGENEWIDGSPEGARLWALTHPAPVTLETTIGVVVHWYEPHREAFAGSTHPAFVWGTSLETMVPQGQVPTEHRQFEAVW